MVMELIWLVSEVAWCYWSSSGLGIYGDKSFGGDNGEAGSRWNSRVLLKFDKGVGGGPTNGLVFSGVIQHMMEFNLESSRISKRSMVRIFDLKSWKLIWDENGLIWSSNVGEIGEWSGSPKWVVGARWSQRQRMNLGIVDDLPMMLLMLKQWFESRIVWFFSLLFYFHFLS